MSSIHYDHIVIGAGISGSSAAYQLAKRGTKVLLLEKVKDKFPSDVFLRSSLVSSSSQQRKLTLGCGDFENFEFFFVGIDPSLCVTDIGRSQCSKLTKDVKKV